MARRTFTLQPRGPYSLDACARFITGFRPAGQTAGSEGEHLHLAFVPEGEDEVAGVCLQSDGNQVQGEIFGDVGDAAVRSQVERILSLDVDGSGYRDVGRRDPVIGQVQRRYPGLRPVLFFSPFEAAVWALISQRVRMTQAATIKARVTREHGPMVDIHGDRRQAFPGPVRVMELTDVRGLFGRKLEYLQQLADAAHAGRLDPVRLRALPEADALAELRRLPGVGEFSARLILLRGVGLADGTPAREPRLLQAVSLAYGLEGEPAEDELVRITNGWRPYRTWVTVLLRQLLADEQG